jgi:thiamine pyrophosphokinase
MTMKIVHSFDPITLVGGGDAEVADLVEALTMAPMCVAADSGAELARAAGVDPAAVIGDFDSITPETLHAIPKDRRIHVAEQDSTDFDKALRHTAAPVVLAVGFLGGRVDHQLGAFHVLVARADRHCVLLGREEVVFLCPPAIALPTHAGDVVSLFSLGPVRGTSRGLRWAIDGLTFDPVSRIGTSNEAVGPVEITMDAPAMLVIVPRTRLRCVMQALESAPPSARWTARAERYTAPLQS